ncbi:hypothetical protein [Anaplasma bovis]|uniref:hypothetical protein n=1 Tax=Anaplasma bovis TaxID=186733 RepID=UPI002FF1CFFA
MQEIVGHYKQKTFLWENYSESPTWLLSGRKGIGKYTTALALAKHIFQCDSIDSYPDVMLVDGSTSSMTTIRKVKHFLQMTPMGSSYKMAILDNADDLNENAVNALLKILEEPLGKSLIFLISHNIHDIPIVLQSRCMILPFQELSIEESMQVIKLNYPDMQHIETAASLYPGTPGMVTEEIDSEISLYETIESIVYNKNENFALEKILKTELSIEKIEYLVLRSVFDYGVKTADVYEATSDNKNMLQHISEKYSAILKTFSTSRKLNIQKEATLFKVLEIMRSLVVKQL